MFFYGVYLKTIFFYRCTLQYFQTFRMLQSCLSLWAQNATPPIGVTHKLVMLTSISSIMLQSCLSLRVRMNIRVNWGVNRNQVIARNEAISLSNSTKLLIVVGTDYKSAFTLYLIKNTKFIQRKAEVNFQFRQAYDLYSALVLYLLLESR